jgi:hypothetical protein
MPFPHLHALRPAALGGFPKASDLPAHFPLMAVRHDAGHHMPAPKVRSKARHGLTLLPIFVSPPTITVPPYNFALLFKSTPAAPQMNSEHPRRIKPSATSEDADRIIWQRNPSISFLSCCDQTFHISKGESGRLNLSRSRTMQQSSNKAIRKIIKPLLPMTAMNTRHRCQDSAE